ncbi:hypothetical protein MMC34_007961 [Xylographa carneopallida]|nr:hypothetical protein [Xylographa carneopallida]
MFGGNVFAPDDDIPDLSDKVFLVTGAKHKPALIYLAARTPAKADIAIEEIKLAVPGANISFLCLDLTSFASVAEAAHRFTSQSRRLDVLINNAGIMATPAGTTKDGYEIQFGTNHMGHALLTKLLLPTLLATVKEPGADVRIVNLTSEGHNLAPSAGVIFDKAELDAQDFLVPASSKTGIGNHMVLEMHSRHLSLARLQDDPGNNLLTSNLPLELANILYTKELAVRYPTITSVAIHPGVIKTDLYEPNRSSNALLRYGMSLLGPLIFASLPDGAKNQLWAATTKKKNLQNGAYYKPVASLSKGSANAQSEKLAKTLWNWTEEELKKKGY